MRGLLTILFIVLIALSTKGQVFWSEDFSNGIPSDWTNEDLSGLGLLWTYCADTTAYGTIENQGCPFDFTDCDNRQSHFKSNTPENGFACCVTEPFFNQLGETTFESRLTTSAIDCSDESEVYVLFNSHIGVFDQDALDNAFLRVSTDRVNWTTFVPFPDLETSQVTEIGFRRWSFNPEQSMFDISQVAANQDSVFLQWYWDGNREYHWSIDDILLTNINPIPSIDISLTPDLRFHAFMTNFSTPISQIEPVFFLTDAVQLGLDTLRNIEVTAKVTNLEGTNTLYQESVILEELIPNQNAINISFPPYLHDGGIGAFKLTYCTASNLNDGNPSNNSFEYPFEITQNVLKKHGESSVKKDLFPTMLDENNFIENNWSIANHYHIPNGAGMAVDEILFEIPNRSTIQDLGTTYAINDVGILIDVTLYKWDNDNLDDFATATESTPIGTTTFEVSGGDFGDGTNSTQSVKLENLISNDDNIPLEDDQDYFVALEFNRGAGNLFNRLFAVIASTNLNYDATIEANILNDRLRFAAMTRIGPSDTFTTLAFGGNVVPHIWMNMTEAPTTTTTQILPSNAIALSPNPASESSTVTFDFELEENANLELLSIGGELIERIPILNNQAKVNCHELANGTYFVKYSSNKSTALKKLVVLH